MSTGIRCTSLVGRASSKRRARTRTATWAGPRHAPLLALPVGPRAAGGLWGARATSLGLVPCAETPGARAALMPSLALACQPPSA
jgi:hypothetical protein